MSDQMEPLSKHESVLIEGMRDLHRKGIKSVSPGIAEYAKVLFRDGFSTERYNEVVPNLVKKGLILVKYDAPRDGPVLTLTEKALEAFGGNYQHRAT